MSFHLTRDKKKNLITRSWRCLRPQASCWVKSEVIYDRPSCEIDFIKYNFRAEFHFFTHHSLVKSFFLGLFLSFFSFFFFVSGYYSLRNEKSLEIDRAIRSKSLKMKNGGICFAGEMEYLYLGASSASSECICQIKCEFVNTFSIALELIFLDVFIAEIR